MMTARRQPDSSLVIPALLLLDVATVNPACCYEIGMKSEKYAKQPVISDSDCACLSSRTQSVGVSL